MARRKRYGSGIQGAAAVFEDLPLIASPIAAAIVLGVLVWLVPWLMSNFRPAGSGFNYGAAFAPMSQGIGVVLAAGILLFGLKGAIGRAFNRPRLVDLGAQPKSWNELEDLVGQAYKRLGYELVRRGGPRADGGVDLELRRAGEKVLVQCKYWKTWQVGVRPVRELWGVVSAEGATRAVFVTTGGYSAAAREFAKDKAIELLDGPGLSGLLAAARHASATPGR
ncbi:MAG TPA: restriction endonuclease [Candidatus Dormibacteraeota bacterium]|nr:restriction endonuclease [Candidatus Dormibacteraeota bacterium]